MSTYRTGKLEIEFAVKIIQKTWFSRVRRCLQTVVAVWLYNMGRLAIF